MAIIFKRHAKQLPMALKNHDVLELSGRMKELAQETGALERM